MVEDTKQTSGRKWVVRNRRGQVVSSPTTDQQKAMEEANQKNSVVEKSGGVPEFEVKEYLAEA